MFAFFCVVLSCVGRGLALDWSPGSKKLKQEPRMAMHFRSPMLRAERKRNK
jgi:hypothetical protein